MIKLIKKFILLEILVKSDVIKIKFSFSINDDYSL
jgi:hypothetical protein